MSVARHSLRADRPVSVVVRFQHIARTAFSTLLLVALGACQLSTTISWGDHEHRAAQTETVAPAPQGPGDLEIRVLDIGAGLACVARLPLLPGETTHRYMIYDAGHYSGGGNRSFEAIQDFIEDDAEEIEIMVLSHSDADHLGAVDEILDAYTVRRVLRTGLPRTTATWRNANEAIAIEVEHEDCEDINLAHRTVRPGATLRFGDVFVTFLCGFHQPPDDWDLNSLSERRNAGSICVRLTYRSRSVLFAGDAVGRHIGDPNDVCIATERHMVDYSPAVTIDSDVLIAPHHGADNGSSTAFIQAVSPTHVVFSAGHAHEHPRSAAAQRYLANGVALANIFRTDRGDHEGDDEWDHEESGPEGHADPTGDDHISIVLTANGNLSVSYVQ